jgi:PAS domain S-box-containing protein
MMTVKTSNGNVEKLVVSPNPVEDLYSFPVAIFWKNSDSVYMGCNQVFAKTVGIDSPDEIVGKTDFDLPWLPEQALSFREFDRRTMESNTPMYHIVENQRGIDGKMSWVETRKIPLHDAFGKVIGILGLYVDITGCVNNKVVKQDLARVAHEA